MSFVTLRTIAHLNHPAVLEGKTENVMLSQKTWLMFVLIVEKRKVNVNAIHKENGEKENMRFPHCYVCKKEGAIPIK